jgi:hypothetical protein
MSEKKAPVLRIYPVNDGKQRWIEASSPAAAILFAFKPKIGEPLTPADLMTVIREHGPNAIESVATSATPSA